MKPLKPITEAPELQDADLTPAAFRQWLVEDAGEGITFYSKHACRCPLAMWFNALFYTWGAERPAKVYGESVYLGSGNYALLPWMQRFIARFDEYGLCSPLSRSHAIRHVELAA